MQKFLLILLLSLLTWSSGAAETLPTTPRKDYILYPRLQVLEEGTGTWCGFCPRGMETIERLRKDGKVNFVAIAVHKPFNEYYAEPMQVDDYSFLTFEGFPGGYINRKEIVGMGYGYTDYLLRQQEQNVPYKVELEVVKTDALDYDINITTTLGFNNNDTHLRLQYVLVEDSVGPYAQSNFYAGDPQDGGAPSWQNKPQYGPHIFQDVARKVYPVGEAAETTGLLPQTMRRGEAVKQTFHLFLPGSVAKAQNCRVVALLIDTETREILNAAVQELRTVTAIHLPLARQDGSLAEPSSRATQTSTPNAAHYDLSGRPISPTSRGVHVVRGRKVVMP